MNWKITFFFVVYSSFTVYCDNDRQKNANPNYFPLKIFESNINLYKKTFYANTKFVNFGPAVRESLLSL